MHVFVKSLINEEILFKGGSGGPPPEIFWLLGSQMVHSSAILGQCTPIPLPPPLQKTFSLQIYTDLKNGPGSWKKSEIRFKSENFDPCMISKTNDHRLELK